MATYLDAIVAWHRRRAASDDRDLDALVAAASAVGDENPTRGFARRITDADGLAVIAEFKRRSPSKGPLAPDMDPAVTAVQYSAGGATCMSVLTDSEHFGGSFEDLAAARGAVDLPVIRKDFTVDARDVCDARINGADAVLLIVAVLDDAELREYGEIARTLGMDALVECHDEAEVERALRAGATMVGVNQRDLVTFNVDQERAVRVLGSIPSSVVRVAESGVRGPADAAVLGAAGYDAVLVGESVVTAEDPGRAVTDLRLV